MQRQSITVDLQKIYKMYFGCHLGYQDKPWAQDVQMIDKVFVIEVPMIWREQKLL